MSGPRRGSCLCGDVRFRIEGEIRLTSDCHCVRCRKWAGHHWPAAEVAQDHLVLENGAESLAWFPTDKAERGFCVICGSSLFWRVLPEGGDTVWVGLGALDGETGLTISRHVCTDEAGDYYTPPQDIK